MMLIETRGRFDEEWRPFLVCAKEDVESSVRWVLHLSGSRHEVRAVPYGDDEIKAVQS